MLRQWMFSLVGVALAGAAAGAGPWQLPQIKAPQVPRPQVPSRPNVPPNSGTGASQPMPARPGTVGIQTQPSGGVTLPPNSGPGIVAPPAVRPAQPGTLGGLNLQGGSQPSQQKGGFGLWDHQRPGAIPTSPTRPGTPANGTPLGTTAPGTVQLGNTAPGIVVPDSTKSPGVVAPPVIRPPVIQPPVVRPLSPQPPVIRPPVVTPPTR